MVRGLVMSERSLREIRHYIKSMDTGISIESLTANNMSSSHAHTEYELYFLMEGSRRFLIKNNFYKIVKGDLILIAPDILHKTLDETPSEYKRLVINFPKVLLDNVIGETKAYENLIDEGAIIIRNLSVSNAVMDEISQLEAVAQITPHKSAEFEFISMSVLYKLMYFLVSSESILLSTRINKKENNLISAILEYINCNYTRAITLTELSSKFYISEFHLCRSFKKTTGRTVVEYINYLRIEKSKQILTQSGKTIKDVANICGFKSTSHFNHVFKEYEKINPSQFIKSRK